MNTGDQKGKANRRLAMRLAVVVLAMFGFGFALVPLYDVFCQITGLNGKTGVANAQALDGIVDESRSIRVSFLGTVNSTLPWEFEPLVDSMEVNPGGIYEVRFTARNKAAAAITGQAVPSVSPTAASRYFDKTECFCFVEQRFEPGEQRELVVRFLLRRELPADINNVTLSYTFFRSPGSA